MYLAKQRMRCVTLYMAQIGKCFERGLFPESARRYTRPPDESPWEYPVCVRRQDSPYGLDADRNAVLMVHLLVYVVENLLKIRENLAIPSKQMPVPPVSSQT